MSRVQSVLATLTVAFALVHCGSPTGAHDAITGTDAGPVDTVSSDGDATVRNDIVNVSPAIDTPTDVPVSTDVPSAVDVPSVTDVPASCFPFCDAGGSTCTPPPGVVDVSAGGDFRGAFTTMAPDAGPRIMYSCVFGPPTSQLYRALFSVTLTTTQDVHVTATDTTTQGIVLLRGCDPSISSTEVACMRQLGTGEETILNVAPGTYLVVAFDQPSSGSIPAGAQAALHVSFSDPSPPPANDSCDRATDLPAPSTFDGTLRGARPDAFGNLAVFYRFILPAASDVEFSQGTIVGDCHTAGAPPAAPTSRGGWVHAPGLAAGTWYLVVPGSRVLYGDPTAGLNFTVAYRLRTPANAGAGDGCAGATALPASGTVMDDLFGATNSTATAASPFAGTLCSRGGFLVEDDGDADRFFTLHLATVTNVSITASGSPVDLSLFANCADVPLTTTACASAAITPSGPIALSATAVPAGDYVLRVQAQGLATTPPGAYALTVGTFVPESTCTTPAGMLTGPGSDTLTGTASTFDDHRGTACGGATVGDDVVYVLNITARSRVAVDTSASAHGVVAYVRSSCSTATSQLSCAAPTSIMTLEVGTYYLIIDSTTPGPTPYSVTVDRILL